LDASESDPELRFLLDASDSGSRFLLDASDPGFRFLLDASEPGFRFLLDASEPGFRFLLDASESDSGFRFLLDALETDVGKEASPCLMGHCFFLLPVFSLSDADASASDGEAQRLASGDNERFVVERKQVSSVSESEPTRMHSLDRLMPMAFAGGEKKK
jgi:hypothetical protein